jgi:hypothetical protein
MKVEIKTIPPVPVEPEVQVVVTMTPRQAYLLNRIFGQWSHYELAEYLNNGCSILHPPMDNVDIDLREPATIEEAKELSETFFNKFIKLNIFQ